MLHPIDRDRPVQINRSPVPCHRRRSPRQAKRVCATAIRGSTDPDVADVDAGGGAVGAASLGPHQRLLGRALFSDRSQIALRMVTRDDRADRRGVLARAGSRRRSRFRDTLAHRRLGVAPGARRSRSAAVARSSIATATCWSCRRCRRARSACCPTLDAAARGADRRATACSSATTRGSAQLEGLEQRVSVVHGEVPETVRVHEGPDRVRRRSCAAGRRPGCSSISARTTRPPPATPAAGCSTASATTAASRWRWRRRARASRRSTSRPTAVGADPRQRRAQRPAARRGARGQRLRRAAPAREGRRPLRHDRPRPAGVRQEQGVARRRRWPATRRSTCGRCGCSSPAASW